MIPKVKKRGPNAGSCVADLNAAVDKNKREATSFVVIAGGTRFAVVAESPGPFAHERLYVLRRCATSAGFLSSNRLIRGGLSSPCKTDHTMKFLLLATALLISHAGVLAAQDNGAPPADAPRVYLDCSWYCDTDYLRTEMKWVNWVRDQADAQVHVLVTRQGTGGGGGQFKLNFIGLKEREGKSDTLTYVSSQNDSEDEVRQGWPG
jgi:hypothetical protein